MTHHSRYLHLSVLLHISCFDIVVQSRSSEVAIHYRDSCAVFSWSCSPKNGMF